MPSRRPSATSSGMSLLDLRKGGWNIGTPQDEIVRHLDALMGSEVEVVLEVHARLKDGAPDNVVRTVLENARALKFETSGFEDE